MKKEEMDSKLKNTFDELQIIPPRDPQAAARGRVIFLKQAAVLPQLVAREADQRHNRWSDRIFTLYQSRQHLPGLNALIAVVLAVVVLFGGTGATVYAAQDSLPDQALYPVKTWSEEVTLSLTGSPQMRLNHALDFSDRRVTEMSGMLAAGKPIPETVENRFQDELTLALELAAGMEDAQAIQQLERIRQRAECQQQTMTMLMSGVPESMKPILLRAQVRLREQIQLAAMGEEDPQGFRMQVQQRFQNQLGGNQPTGTPGQYSPGATSPTGTPMPGGTGYGPGPGGNQSTGTPDQYGPGATHPTGTSMPSGTSYGPGPGGSKPTTAPGQYGPGLQPWENTPQPGGGSGHGP